MTKPSVLIIGSGIIGSGFAYAAAQRGLPTRVLSSLPVNSGGTATANSWAWINANTNNDRDYFDLRHPDNFQPCDKPTATSRVFVAIWLGSTRLIDNCALG